MAASRAALALLLALAPGCGADADDGAGADLAPPAPGEVTAVVNRAYLPALDALLAAAQTSVQLVHLELNRDADGDAIVARLAAAAARGLRVRVLLEGSVDSNGPRVRELRTAGVDARLDTTGRYTHAKLVVVDGEGAGAAARALLGSTNLSRASLQRNNEANVRIDAPALAGWFGRYAQAVFDAPDDTPALAPLTTPLGTALKDGDYVPRAGALIDAAQRRVQLVVYGMNVDPRYPDGDVQELVRRLGAARRRGVQVRVLLETSEPDLGVNAVNLAAAQALRDAGVDVRLDPPGTITHAKVLLGDDEVLVGSNNWGYGGFRTYHEVGLHTRAPAVVAALAGYLDELWATGTDAR